MTTGRPAGSVRDRRNGPATVLHVPSIRSSLLAEFRKISLQLNRESYILELLYCGRDVVGTPNKYERASQ